MIAHLNTFKKWCPVAIVLAALVVFSCRKSNELGSRGLGTDTEFNKEAARDWFRKNLKNDMERDLKNPSLNSGNHPFGGTFNLKWRLAKTFKRGIFEMVEVPVLFEKKRLMMYSFDGNGGDDVSAKEMNDATFSKFIIYRGPDGRILTRILTFTPDRAYIAKYGKDATLNGSDHLEKNFSGYVEFRSWNQRSLFIYRVKDGSVVNQVKLRRKDKNATVNSGTHSALSSCNQICDPVYEVHCYQGEANPESGTGYDVICEYGVAYWDCYDDPFCNPNPYEPWEPEPPYEPCDDPANYYLPECGYNPDPCLDLGQCGGTDPGTPEEAPVVEAADAGKVINNLTDHLKCFSTASGAAAASITLYVDQPIANSSATHDGTEVGHTFIAITQGGITRVVGYYPSDGVTPPFDNTSPRAFVDDGGHGYDVKVTVTNLSAAQLQGALNYMKNSVPGTYDLNDYNCTDFGIRVMGAAGITIPDHNGSWGVGSGSNPGTLGQDIRGMTPGTNMTITKSPGTAVTQQGTCP